MQAQRLKPDSNYAGSSPPVAAARRSHSTAQIARSVNELCACGGGCPRCSDNRLPGDFSQVRFHPSAPEVTGPLRARAVTMGQDIYFRPGEFRPGTPAGEKLIAHELAHTLQTRPGRTEQSHPAGGPAEAALEDNADALATGETSVVIPAPSGLPLRSPLPGESTADTTRREELLGSIRQAENSLLNLLTTGGLINTDEAAAERAGVRGVVVPASTAGRSDENFISYSDRNRMIQRILRSLIAMADFYRTNPIPATLPPATLAPKDTPDAPDYFDTVITTPEGSSSYGGAHSAWTQLQAAYELYLLSQGLPSIDYWVDAVYLIPDYTITTGAARGAPRLSRGIASGAYMVFPDVEHEPYNYWRLDGYTAMPRGAQIIEFWHDDIGYYYMLHDQRIDVPSPWSSDRPRTR